MDEISRQPQQRIFFALWPTGAEQAALAAWQAQLQQPCKGRPMRKANLHATLAFIGAASAEQVTAAINAATQIHGQAFTVRWDAVRYWPHNHIVHAAPARIPAALTALEEQLREKLKQQGFGIEQRNFQPHVTLVRNARCGSQALPEVAPVEWRVEAFALMQSLNDAVGTHYAVLQRFLLA